MLLMVLKGKDCAEKLMIVFGVCEDYLGKSREVRRMFKLNNLNVSDIYMEKEVINCIAFHSCNKVPQEVEIYTRESEDKHGIDLGIFIENSLFIDGNKIHMEIEGNVLIVVIYNSDIELLKKNMVKFGSEKANLTEDQVRSMFIKAKKNNSISKMIH